MNSNDNKRIYREVTARKIPVHHACEVGVYLPMTSNVIDFIQDSGVAKVTLVEPNPRIVKEIQEAFAGMEKIELHPIAIHEYNGTLNLFEADASTFAEGLMASPALINDQYQKEEVKKITTDCKMFSEVDSGDIDLLSIDTEGCEWYVLKTMVSRPKVISIETHGKFYTNPFLKEISEWMKREGYHTWYRTRSDTVYATKSVKKTQGDTFRLFFTTMWIAMRRAKRVLK